MPALLCVVIGITFGVLEPDVTALNSPLIDTTAVVAVTRDPLWVAVISLVFSARIFDFVIQVENLFNVSWEIKLYFPSETPAIANLASSINFEI